MCMVAVWSGDVLASGIKVVPSKDRVEPGEDFYVDIVAEEVPLEGLGAVQFRLNIDSIGSDVTGVSDLGQASSSDVSVVTPLLISPPTESRSGIGDFFWDGKGSNGILVMDNEPLRDGAGLYTYAHTYEANPPSGSGSVARFMLHVGAGVEAEKIVISLSEARLLDGGGEYPLDYNTGATIELRCITEMPSLIGLNLSSALNAISSANLTVGNVYEIDNANGAYQLGGVLLQSYQAGSKQLCETPIDIAINIPPDEVTQPAALDKTGDDTGVVVFSWTPSASTDTAGYRVYFASTLLKDINDVSSTGTEIGGLANGVSHKLKVTAYDTLGNESQGVVTQAIPIDDVAPSVSITGVDEGAYYKVDITPAVSVFDTNLSGQEVALNSNVYDLSPISTEDTFILTVTATDLSGNETSKTVNFTIDKTPPSITITGVSEGEFYNTDRTPEVTITDANPRESSITLNGEGYATGNPITDERTYTLAVSAEDKAGNTSVENVSFTIDKTAPSSTAEVGTPQYTQDGTLLITGLTTVTVTAQDTGISPAGVDKIEFNIDGADAWSVYSEPVTLAGLSDGSHAVSYRVYDRAGNVEAEKTLTVTIDNTPPETALGIGEPRHEDGEIIYVTTATGFTLEATDALSGVSLTEYRINGGEWTDYAPFTIAEEGSHAIEYRSTDNLSNVENANVLTVVVDNTPPATEISVGTPEYQDGESLYVTSATEFALESTDALSAVASTEYRLDDGEWKVYEPFTVAGEGVHAITYRSIDNLGNVEDGKTLEVIVDDTAPETTISVGTPEYRTDENLYVTSATGFTLEAEDAVSGVASTEYRIDNGDWTAYAPFTIPTEGTYTIGFRSTDNVENVEAVKALTVIVDNTPPDASVNVGEPKYQGVELYVTSQSAHTVTAIDNLSGVAEVEYSIDNGAWVEAVSAFTIEGEGGHTISTRAADYLGNVAVETLDITVDDTAPETSTSYGGVNQDSGDEVLLAPESAIVLSAADNLSGVGATYYRFDEETQWSEYASAITLSALTPGRHTLGYRSVDNVGNEETEKSLTFVVVDIDVEVNIITVPRALVWVSDPQDGASSPPYTLDDIRKFIDQALSGGEIYYTVVTDREAFREAFRSGIYNVAAIIDQETPFDTIFLREMREAVNNGMGLIVSGWGNSVRPLLNDVLGVKFTGSESMDTSNKTVYMYESPVSALGQYVVTTGRVLEVEHNGGTLVGVVNGEYVCSGIKGVTLEFPASVKPGDTVRAVLTSGKGRNAVTVDEETVVVDTLPAGEVNTSGGTVFGDLVIGDITESYVTLGIAPYDASKYLEPDYYLEVTVNHADGSVTRGRRTKVRTTCADGLAEGTTVGPYTLTGVSVDYAAEGGGSGGNTPAAVLNDYGKGKALFLAFDLVESAAYGYTDAYGEILKKAAVYLTPTDEKFLAGGVHLVESTVKSEGREMDVKAEEVLEEGLTYLPLFDLVYQPLEFEFHLADGESGSYRYFMRTPEESGEYAKTTELYIKLYGEYKPFGSHIEPIIIEDDRWTLHEKAESWLMGQLSIHPGSADKINAILDDMGELAGMPTSTKDDMAVVIHHTVQITHAIEMLGFDTTEARELMDEYLRIMESIYNSME